MTTTHEREAASRDPEGPRRSRHWQRRIIALSGLSALALGATILGWSASIDASTNASGSNIGVLLSATPVVQVATNATYGKILITNAGRALYTLDTDHNGLSTCTPSCLSVWPALTVPAGTTPTGGAGVTGTVGAALQSNGTDQVTYNGAPVYTFIGDTAAREVTGQGVNGFFVVVVASTTTTTTTVPTTTTTTVPSTTKIPAAPTGVKAVSESTVTGSGSLTVSYTAGANNGSAITNFTATCMSRNGGRTRSAIHSGATAAPITVTGVDTNKAYECTVSATDAEGTSAASVPSAAVIVGAPAEPAAPSVTLIGAAHLKVSFRAPSDNGAPITSFKAVCRSAHGISRGKTGAASPLGVKNVSAGQIYTCTVQATNRRGTGPPSAPSDAVKA
ncbi:MAG: fibronectin type III domain-containing protein [Acidimicrobiia bacterium]